MQRLDLSPAGASVFTLLLAFVIVYLAVMTVWAHVRAMREIGVFTELAPSERWRKSRPWVHRIALRYGAGFLVFAWGSLALGLIEAGAGFLTSQPGLFVIWMLSPVGIYALAHLYWYAWIRVGVPPSGKS